MWSQLLHRQSTAEWHSWMQQAADTVVGEPWTDRLEAEAEDT